MDHQEYTWSETEYALRDFIELYGKRLPQLVDVRHCYMGADNRLHTAEHGKVILVYAIDKQRRLMATEQNKRRVSIPLNHPLKVHIFIEGGKLKQSKSVSSVERLLKKKSKFNFTFERDESLPAHLRTGGEATVNLGSLDVAFVSDERFVVGHGVREGDVFGMEPLILPTYVTVKLAVASGFAQGTKKAFQKLLTELHRSAKRRAKDSVLNQEIIIFPTSNADSEQHYVDPLQVVRLSLPENTSRGLLERRTSSVPSGPSLPPRSLSSASGRSLVEYVQGPQTPVFRSEVGNIPEVVRFPPGSPIYSDDDKRDGNYLTMASGLYMELTGSGQAGSEASDDDTYRSNVYKKAPSVARLIKPHQGSVTSSVSSNSTGNSAGNSTGTSTVFVSPCLQEVFSTLDDVPLNFAKLTPIEVNDCLRLLKMSEYLPRFISRCVDGEMVVSLDENILVTEFGFSMFDAIKMMKFAKLGYRPKNCPCAAGGDDHNT